GHRRDGCSVLALLRPPRPTGQRPDAVSLGNRHLRRTSGPLRAPSLREGKEQGRPEPTGTPTPQLQGRTAANLNTPKLRRPLRKRPRPADARHFRGKAA